MVSAVSENVPVVQVLRVVEQRPLVSVGVVAPVYSYAPMSQAEPWGREVPIISVAKPDGACVFGNAFTPGEVTLILKPSSAVKGSPSGPRILFTSTN